MKVGDKVIIANGETDIKGEIIADLRGKNHDHDFVVLHITSGFYYSCWHCKIDKLRLG